MKQGVIADRADFTAAKLWHARLNRASFRGACLRSANLMGVHAIRTDFRGADLSEAVLIASKLYGADLSDANLDGVSLAAAAYDIHTKWPVGFDPVKAGGILVEDVPRTVEWVGPGRGKR